MTPDCSIPIALKRKMTNVNSLLMMLQRTIDSPDCSVYTKEMSCVLDSAIEQMSECEALTARLAGE